VKVWFVGRFAFGSERRQKGLRHGGGLLVQVLREFRVYFARGFLISWS
jgi:hypothetical protein